MVVKLQFVIVLYRNLTRVSLQRKLIIAFIKHLACAQFLLISYTANGDEIVNIPTVKVDESNSNGTLSTIKLKSDNLSNDLSTLNNSGIVETTDFSKDLGPIRQGQSLSSAGFANKISFISSVDYDTNPALDNSRKRSVWIYTLIPQALLEYTGEVDRFYLDSAIVVQRPSNEEILPDRDDPRLTVGWTRTYESGNFGLNANYSQFLSRAQEIRTIGAFNNTLDSENTQKTRSLGANWQHRFAQRWSVLTNADYTQDSFSGGVNLIGSKSYGVRSKLNYEYTERLDTYAQIGYVQISPDSPLQDTDLVRLAIGADYLISNALKGSFRAGQYHISGAQSETGWEAGAKLAYDTDRTGYSAELNRELGAAGGVGGFQKTDTFRLGWFYNISEIDNLSANYSLTKFKQDLQLGLPKQEIQQIDVSYTRMLISNWNARANMSYREFESGSRNQGLLAGVSLIYGGLSF
jgi:hypothetical protein